MGHFLFLHFPLSRTKNREHIDSKDIVMLAPVSVHADYFHKNIGVTTALAMPISIILMLITVFYFVLLFPEKMNIFDTDGLSIEFTINLKSLLYIVGLLIYAFLHEMIHALTIPNAIHSNKTYWGINGCFGFVYSEEKIKKRDFF